jgi:hypothetical protein
MCRKQTHEYGVHSRVSLLPSHDTHSCTYLNILLSSPSGASVTTCLHEQYKKELKITLRRRNATSTPLSMGRALELRHQVQTSGPVAVLRPASNFRHPSTGHRENIVIPKLGLRSQMDEVDENCALLGYYAASSGDFLPSFRDNLSVPSSGAKKGPIGCPEMSVRNYP